jgi:hypothetical protein
MGWCVAAARSRRPSLAGAAILLAPGSPSSEQNTPIVRSITSGAGRAHRHAVWNSLMAAKS